MKQTFLFLTSVFLISCHSKSDYEGLNEMQSRMPEIHNTDLTLKGEKWLVESIEGHFANDNPKMIMMTTPEYYEFKLDALNLNLGLSESLTQESFEKKWSEKYNLNREDVYSPFLISAQDFGEIKVKKCEFKKHESDTLVYEVEISDVKFNVDYASEIKILPTDNGYLIADVYKLK